MIVNFLYNNSNWVVGVTVVSTFVLCGLCGLLLVHSLVPKSHRRQHNEFVGFIVAVVSVVYAVLLAFIAIAVWESFGKAGEIAAREASLVGDLGRDSMVMPEPLRSAMIKDVDDYLTWVVKEEWPAMARGEHLSGDEQEISSLADTGWEKLFHAHEILADFRTADAIHTAMFSELLSRLNSLYDARRDRLLVSEERLQGVVWGIVLFGASFTIAFTYLFGMESLAMHMVMTAAVAATVALVVMLIIAFDYPFRGKVQISPDAFIHVQTMMHKQVLQSAGKG